ncbi:MAG: sulfatase-like hydrolase/transferase [Verrucomicrobiota bacterium]
MNLRLLPVLLVALCVAAFAVRAGAAGAAPRPNVVLIFADDLGYGDLGCFGHPTIATPNIDGMAMRGLKLTSFYSAPSCVPARSQLMLGKYSGRAHITGTSADGKSGIPDSEVTLPQALKSAGYATAMIGKWHLGHVQEKFLPTSKGFDSYFGLPYSNDMVRPWVQTDMPLWLYEDTRRVENPVQHDTLLQRYTARGAAYIREKRSTPFFLYFAPAMVHLPLAASEKFRGKSRAGLFGDAVEELDWAVGELLKAIRESGKENDTLVIFTSDNGPWTHHPPRMMQAGNLPWHTGSPGALRMSKGSTYEGGPRVPCLVEWKGHIPPARSSAEMVATMDLHTTILTLATGSVPRHAVDGHDLTAFLTGKTTASPRKDLFYFNARQLDGVRVGPWKLRLNSGVELFNLDLDPSERYNMEKDHPEIVADLKARLVKMAGETGGNHKWK